MLARIVCVRVAVGVLLAGAAGIALAQDAEQPRRSFSGLLTPASVEVMADNYARSLARKYNLTAEQDQFTQQYLRSKTNEFLERHKDKLFELVDRLVEARSGGDLDQQGLIAWGKAAVPLYEEAKLLIVEGNNEWRLVLTEEQCKIHDADLKQMYESFATTEDQLHRMVSGQMTVDEFRRGQPLRPAQPNARADVPAPVPTAAQPKGPVQPQAQPQAAAQPLPRPATPGPALAPGGPVTAVPGKEPGSGQAGQPPTVRPGSSDGGDPGEGGGRRRRFTPGGGAATSQPDAAELIRAKLKARGLSGGSVGKDFESQWEAYVREFIQRYQLNDDQAQKARSILKDCQEQGRQYVQRHKGELDELDKRTSTPGEAKDKAKQTQETNERRAKLLEPIGRIFDQQLKPRLEKLPTTAQRAAAEAAGKRNPAGPGQEAHRRPQPKPGERPPTPPPEAEPIPPSPGP